MNFPTYNVLPLPATTIPTFPLSLSPKMLAVRCCGVASVHRRSNGLVALWGGGTLNGGSRRLEARSGCGWPEPSLTRAALRCRCRPRRTLVVMAAKSGLADVATVEEGEGGGSSFAAKEKFLVERCQKVEGKIMVTMEEREEEGKVKGRFVVGCDLDGKWVLHWGVTYFDGFDSEWDRPPLEMTSPGSVPVRDYAVETPLKKSSSASEGQTLHEVAIDLPCDDSIAAIHFVLKEEETGAWFRHRGRDFILPLSNNIQEYDPTKDGTDDFRKWPSGLSRISSSDVKPGEHSQDSQHENVNRYYREYSILKEERVMNFITASVMRSEEMKSNHIVFDTDIPGDVVIHWGVCRDDSKTWQFPMTPYPPRSKVFRKKAIQTLLQKKTNEIGSWGLFPLDKDIVGVPFVIKVNESTYLDNVGNDFYVPITSEAKHHCNMAEFQGLLNGNIEQVVDPATYTDEIINDIRNLMTGISTERSMGTSRKQAQESILEEIEKLAAEAYSIFRNISTIFIEETTTEVETMKPPIHVSPGRGTGYDIICQGFNWESNKSGRWYLDLSAKADELAKLGFTAIWLPPPTESVSPQGYMPSDLYNLNSRYGSLEDLKCSISRFHDVGIKVLGDIVLNHRCAQYQNKYGVWNIYGGRLNWDDRAIVADDPHFQGKGNKSGGEMYHAAPNIDHSQDFVRRDLKEWLCWLRQDVGYDGWRLDFVRGFWGGYVKDYMEASEPYFAVGEFWDSLSYTYGQMDHNQDAHRQRIIDWINSTNGTSAAFDITTKGIMHTALENYEYWRLSDGRGKPPGVIGWWPSRAVTFIENHDTGSTQGHWRFPAGREMQGYAYILTHPGTPTVFIDHIHSHYQQEISKLISLRQRAKLHCRSKVKIVKAEKDVYAAEIDEKVAMKIGPGYYEPGGHQRWIVAAEGREYKVWESQ